MTENGNITEIENTLIREIAIIVAADEQSITPETSLQSLGIDSIRLVEILIIIEKQFGVKLIEAGLTRDDLKDVVSLARSVAKMRKP